MRLTKAQLTQIIKEELRNALNEANEKEYLLFTKAFCMGNRCRADLRVVKTDTSKIIATAGAMGRTKKAAVTAARIKLTEKLAKLNLDIAKIKSLVKEELHYALNEGPIPPIHGSLASRIRQLEKKVKKLDEFLGQMEFNYGQMPDTVEKLTNFIISGGQSTAPPPMLKK